MRRKLLKQIKNEWRTNVWLALELLIVSVVLWYVVDFLYVYQSYSSLPKGFDISHTYRLSFNEITPKSPDYIPGRDENCISADMVELLSRLQHHPMVEAASISKASFPYNGSNSGTGFVCDTMSNQSHVFKRFVSPDFVKVFRYEGTRGESFDRLSQLLSEEKLIISDNILKRYGISGTSLIGKEVLTSTAVSDTSIHPVVGAAILTPRYHDYTAMGETVVSRLPESWFSWEDEVCVRIKPEEDHDVVERFMDQAESLLHVGNVILVNVIPFKEQRRMFMQLWENERRNMFVGLGFLVLNIFLGIFGTFWFRTQQRTGEIAIRKAMGGTRTAIFRRLISEGLLLLVVVTPIAFGIDCLLAYEEFSQYYHGYFVVERVAVCALISFGLIALMVIGGICFPAYLAQRINPAVALKDE